MAYAKLHRFLLLLLYAVAALVIATAICAAYYSGLGLLGGVVVIALALVWIGWEVYRISFSIQYIAGYIDGATKAYLSMTEKQGG
jgi:hypothetical protein